MASFLRSYFYNKLSFSTIWNANCIDTQTIISKVKIMKKTNRKLFPSSMLVVIVLATAIGFSSCKGKKKLSEITDTEEAMQEELEPPVSEPVEEEPEVVENPEKRVAVYEPTMSERLDNQFVAIANASSTTVANQRISETIRMFSNGNAPVLIIFYRSDGVEDYDEPTTISKYLNYLKDTGNSTAIVEEMVMDDYGRIKELVLKRK